MIKKMLLVSAFALVFSSMIFAQGYGRGYDNYNRGGRGYSDYGRGGCCGGGYYR